METETKTPGRAGKARIVLTEEQFLALFSRAIGEDRDAIRIWQTENIALKGDIDG